MVRRGADLVVEALAAAGVTHLFSLSGNQILSVYDATLGRGVQIVHTRHEAAAVHMADRLGAAHRAGRPGGRVALALHGEPSAMMDRLTAAVPSRAWRHAAWGEGIRAARTSVPADWEALRASSRQPVHPLRVCAATQPLLDAGGVLVSDGGEFGQWMQAGLGAETRLINGLSGSIGSALPMALAAKLALPDRRVTATFGDGTFGFHAFELDTAARYGLPVVCVVGNDGRWNAEHQLQRRNYGPDRTVSCEPALSRYDRVAEALAGHGEHVEQPEDLEPALARAVESGRPACVNVVVEPVAAPTYTTAGH